MAADSGVGLRYVKEGTPLYNLCGNWCILLKKALYCIYPKNIVEFIVFDFTTDSIKVERREKETSIKEQILSGEIVKNSNLTFAS